MAEPRLPPGQRAPALAFALFLLLVAGSAAVLFALKLGLAPSAVVAFYRGSEASFAAPRSAAGLLEVALSHLVTIPLVLFAVAHAVGWAGAGRHHRLLVATSFAAALAGVAAGFGVRFVAPWIAWGKLLAFVTLEAALLGWAVLLAAAALPAPEALARRRAPDPAPAERAA